MADQFFSLRGRIVPDNSRIPEHFVNRTRTLMALSTDKDKGKPQRIFPFEVLKIDSEGKGWLDPRAEWIEKPVRGDNLLPIRRTESGFTVFLGLIEGHRWSVETRPNTDIDGGSIPWLPVASFDEGQG